MITNISRDRVRNEWMLTPHDGSPIPATVFMRDVTWTTTRARGEVIPGPLPDFAWTKLFWRPGGFDDTFGSHITESAYARFDPDGSAWYV